FCWWVYPQRIGPFIFTISQIGDGQAFVIECSWGPLNGDQYLHIFPIIHFQPKWCRIAVEADNSSVRIAFLPKIKGVGSRFLRLAEIAQRQEESGSPIHRNIDGY